MDFPIIAFNLLPFSRIGSGIQVDLLERINPKLAKYPFNPNDFHFNPLQIIVSKGKDLCNIFF